MKIDEAIQEIRNVRHEISEEHGHDTRALVEYYQKLDQQYQDRMLKSRHQHIAPAQATEDVSRPARRDGSQRSSAAA